MSYIYRFIHIIILHCVDAESRRPDASDASASFYLICLSSDPLSLCSPSAAGEGRDGEGRSGALTFWSAGAKLYLSIPSIHLSIYLSIPSFYLCIHLSIYVSIPSFGLCIHLSMYLSIPSYHLCIHLS